MLVVVKLCHMMEVAENKQCHTLLTLTSVSKVGSVINLVDVDTAVSICPIMEASENTLCPSCLIRSSNC